MDLGVISLLGATLALIGVLATALFGRRSARETTDLATIRLLTESQAAELIRIREEMAELREEYKRLEQDNTVLRAEKRLREESDGRIIRALRFYITDLLEYIARETGHEPPSPRFPID